MFRCLAPFSPVGRPDPVEVLRDETPGEQTALRRKNNLILFGINPAYIQRSRKSKSKTAPLTDGVTDQSFVPAKNMPLFIYEISLRSWFPGSSLDKVCVFPSRYKTDVLRIRLTGIHEPVMPGNLPDLLLICIFTEWENCMRKLLLRQRIQDIGLILLQAPCAQKLPPAALFVKRGSRVMPGHNRLAAQFLRTQKQLTELHISITIDAWVRSAARLVDPDKAVNHLFSELR